MKKFKYGLFYKYLLVKDTEIVIKIGYDTNLNSNIYIAATNVNYIDGFGSKVPDVVGINQLQEMLGIGRSLAYRLVKEKSIKSIKSGREYKILKTSIINYLMGELNE